MQYPLELQLNPIAHLLFRIGDGIHVLRHGRSTFAVKHARRVKLGVYSTVMEAPGGFHIKHVACVFCFPNQKYKIMPFNFQIHMFTIYQI